jgi:hypothetical protein
VEGVKEKEAEGVEEFRRRGLVGTKILQRRPDLGQEKKGARVGRITPPDPGLLGNGTEALLCPRRTR